MSGKEPLLSDFLFATGIENSYPVIAGGARVDEMDKCGHYRRWKEALALVHDLQVRHLTDAVYAWFLGQPRDFSYVLGTDYYALNEHLLRADGSTRAAGEGFGYYVLAREYHARYGLPLMHTETNLKENEGAAGARGRAFVRWRSVSFTPPPDRPVNETDARNACRARGLHDGTRFVPFIHASWGSAGTDGDNGCQGTGPAAQTPRGRTAGPSIRHQGAVPQRPFPSRPPRGL